MKKCMFGCMSEKWSLLLNFIVCVWVWVWMWMCLWVHSNDDDDDGDEAQRITNICHFNNKIGSLAAIVSQCYFNCHIEICRKFMENTERKSKRKRESDTCTHFQSIRNRKCSISSNRKKGMNERTNDFCLNLLKKNWIMWAEKKIVCVNKINRQEQDRKKL